MISGKRNNLEDFVIVEFERSGVLGPDNGEFDPLPRPAWILFEYLLDAAQDQFLGRAAFVGSAAFQAPIDRIRNVDRRSHTLSLPYLWSQGNCALLEQQEEGRGAGSNGINPLTEDVKLQVGTFSTTIPAGSFRQDPRGRFKFEGAISGVSLEVQIVPLGGNDFQLKAEAEGANLSGTVNPVTVGLTIGDDSGSTAVTAEFDLSL